jgi:hypothetical protein
VNKIFIFFILCFGVPGFLAIYGQSNGDNLQLNDLNNTASSYNFENFISQYASGIRFKDVLPVALGILAFSYFIWKTSSILSKREVFSQNLKYTASGTPESIIKTRIFYVAKYVLVFPIIMYGWVVVCFFFMYALNTSLDYDVLTMIMVGIITASRIAAHWNEKLAEDIMKFLPFNLLFTLLLNPNLNSEKIIDSIPAFLPIMLELTIFIAFIGVLEGLMKSIVFLLRKYRHRSDDSSLPIEPS